MLLAYIHCLKLSYNFCSCRHCDHLWSEMSWGHIVTHSAWPHLLGQCQRSKQTRNKLQMWQPLLQHRREGTVNRDLTRTPYITLYNTLCLSGTLNNACSHLTSSSATRVYKGSGHVMFLMSGFADSQLVRS